MELDQYTLDTLAKKALGIFLEQGKHPNDIVVSLAQKNDLNDEQARRLCESTNVAIKRYKTHEEHDPQAEFPLADWKTVVQELVDGSSEELGEIMGEKTASLGSDDWELFEELMGDNNISLGKEASGPERTTKDIISVIEMLKQARDEAAKFKLQSEIAKSAAADTMLRYLREEAIKDQNINQAYSISLEKIGSRSEAQHDGVEAFFDIAHGYLSKELNIKIAELTLVPIHGTINPSWSFLRKLSYYMGENANSQKLGGVEITIQHQLDSLMKSIGRTMERLNVEE